MNADAVSSSNAWINTPNDAGTTGYINNLSILNQLSNIVYSIQC